MTYHLSADQIETLRDAIAADGWSKTFRLALTGANLSQHTYESLRDFEVRWRMDNPEEKQSA